MSMFEIWCDHIQWRTLGAALCEQARLWEGRHGFVDNCYVWCLTMVVGPGSCLPVYRVASWAINVQQVDIWYLVVLDFRLRHFLHSPPFGMAGWFTNIVQGLTPPIRYRIDELDIGFSVFLSFHLPWSLKLHGSWRSISGFVLVFCWVFAAVVILVLSMLLWWCAIPAVPVVFDHVKGADDVDVHVDVLFVPDLSRCCMFSCCSTVALWPWLVTIY